MINKYDKFVHSFWIISIHITYWILDRITPYGAQLSTNKQHMDQTSRRKFIILPTHNQRIIGVYSPLRNNRSFRKICHINIHR
jgi:hypothetical protein